MRHILYAGAVTAGSLGVGKAAATAPLVTPTRFPNRVTPRPRCAVAGAINLATVAVAADDHLRPAARAQEQSARGFHWRPKSRQREFDRGLRFVKYFPCTRARHGVGHDIGLDLAVCAGVVPVLFGGIFLPHLEPGGHPCPRPRGRGRLSSRPTGSFQRALCHHSVQHLKPAIASTTNHPYRFGRLRFVAIFTRISTAIHTGRS